MERSAAFAQAAVLYAAGLAHLDTAMAVLKEEGLDRLSGFLAVTAFLRLQLTRDGVIAATRAERPHGVAAG